VSERPPWIDVHVDVLCPFAFQTSTWLRDVASRTGLELRWRFFSLEEVNRAEGKKHPWERVWSYGWSLLRVAAWLRREDMALAGAWYEVTGRALHVEGRKPHDPEVARQLATDIGVDGEVVDRALADPTTNDEILSDHRRVIEAGGFGVPTLFFPDGQCLFGPVLVDPPTGDQALELWDAVVAWTRFPHVYELQRPKTAADLAAIGAALQPYLHGRDWVSINRGKVVDLDHLADGGGRGAPAGPAGPAGPGAASPAGPEIAGPAGPGADGPAKVAPASDLGGRADAGEAPVGWRSPAGGPADVSSGDPGDDHRSIVSE
jgi:2-hydroxychromene-2-carboxylate isomerase